LKKKKKIYEGKSKKIYTLDDSDQLIQEFKDDSVVFEGNNSEMIKGKGIINKDISAYIFGYLEGFHIPTHFIKDVGGREMLVKRLEMIPAEIVMHNIAAGSLCERYGIEEGKELNFPIIEFYLKNNERNDPMINQTHLIAFQLATQDEVRIIERLTSKINAVLKSFFLRRNLNLVDFKLEFGRYKNKILLGDETSLDTIRLSDISSETEPDKINFRLIPITNELAYEEMKKRIFQSNN
jgi:phosphoribosylaminoimidazole-succinocarboxamide synthase